MADISTLDEAQQADKLGFDYIGTTLRGYTSYTKGHILYENDFAFKGCTEFSFSQSYS